MNQLKTTNWSARGVFQVLLMGAVALVGFASIAHANPIFFAPQAKTAVATTTLQYMLAGTATTTLVYDSYNINGTNETSAQNAQNFFGTEKAELLVQFTASSTSSGLNINFEYSNDNIDWYQDTSSNQYAFATTSLPISLNPVAQYTWTFSSSTVDQGAVAANNNRDTRGIWVNVPTRYERAVFTCKLGGTNCAVWAQFVPIKQNP